MTTIGGVKLSGASSRHAPDEARRSPEPRGGESAKSVLDAGRAFLLETLDDVRRVDVTKVVEIDREKGLWELEAEVFRPNSTIRDLGLPVTREVFERADYLLRFEAGRGVVAYGLRGSIDERREKEAP